MSYHEGLDDLERLNLCAEEADSRLYSYTDLTNMNLFYLTNPAPAKAPIRSHRVEGIGMKDGMYKDVVIPIEKLRGTKSREVPIPGKVTKKCPEQLSQ
jgi:hypothetical protein